MNDTTGFAAFALWNALKLHFGSNSYDYFKYNGKTNVSKSTFATRKDKYQFYRLSRKYTLTELKDFYIANFIENDVQWVGDLMTPEAEDNYKKWLKRTQSLSYVFTNDINFILEKELHNELMKVYRGQHPHLLTFMMRDQISMETLIIMDDMMGFVERWEKQITEDILWPTTLRYIRKYKPFLNYDKEKFKTILKEKVKEYAEA